MAGREDRTFAARVWLRRGNAAGRRPTYAAKVKHGDCFVTVTRYPHRGHAEVYGWNLRDRLPTVPVPLKSPDPDITVNLAKVFQTTFTAGFYRRRLRYADYQPPLKPELAEWSKSRLAAV